MAVRVAGNTLFSSYQDAPSVTLGSTATEGNLLIAVMVDRNGTALANYTVTDNESSTGWFDVLQQGDNLGDSTYRFGLRVWGKIAEGDETSVTCDDGTANSKFIAVTEYELEAGEAWNAFDTDWKSSAEATNVGTDETLGTGNTASVSGDNFLVLTFSGLKTGSNGIAGVPLWYATTGENDTWEEEPGSSNGVAILLADKNDSTTGVRSDSVTFEDFTYEMRTMISAVAVFDLTAAAGSTKALAGTIAAVAAVSGSNPLLQRGFIGSFAAASAVSSGPPLRIRLSMVGSVVGASTFSSQLSRLKKMVGSFAGVSAFTGALSRLKKMVGSFAAVSTLAGALTKAGAGVKLLAGSIASISTIVAVPIKRSRTVQSSFAAVSTVIGALTKTTIAGAQLLAGTIAASSTITATISIVAKAKKATMNGIDTVSGKFVNIVGTIRYNKEK